MYDSGNATWASCMLGSHSLSVELHPQALVMFLFKKIIAFISLCGCVRATVHVWSHRTTCRDWFSPFTMRVLGMELRSSVMAASNFTSCAVMSVYFIQFLKLFVDWSWNRLPSISSTPLQTPMYFNMLSHFVFQSVHAYKPVLRVLWYCEMSVPEWFWGQENDFSISQLMLWLKRARSEGRKKTCSWEHCR